jgi:flagellar export protein FliJ
MARETKPGRFKYSLDTVLKVREIREKQEKEKFAQAQRKFFEEHEKTQRLIREQKDRQDDLVRTFKKGKIDDFGAVLRRQIHLEDLGKRKVKQQEVEKEAEEKRNEQRGVVIEKMKDRKIIEKDKEHRRDEHRKMMDHLEANFFDEIGTTRFVREKLENSEKE